jgi:hypothetical protein
MKKTRSRKSRDTVPLSDRHLARVSSLNLTKEKAKNLCHSFYLFLSFQFHTFIITFRQYIHTTPFSVADPRDPSFHFNADPNSASHQSDANLRRPLIYRHSKARF